METIAHQIFPARFQQIKAAILALEMGDVSMAQQYVQEATGLLPPSIQAPEDILTLFFANAISRRLMPGVPEMGNLYLARDDGQQIRMFNLMAAKFPLVRFSQNIVNEAYCREMQGLEPVVLMDIGIGSGQQMVRLLDLLCERPDKPSQIIVIGIDPAPDSLRAAKSALEKVVADRHTAFSFHAIEKAIETFEDADWQELENLLNEVNGKLVINASFALHHIRPVSYRDGLFMRLNALKPTIFSVIEPYADFLTSRYSERFANAWHHYGLTFRAIDQIDATLDEKNAIKQIFFNREIQDVLSEDTHRVEQFETGEMWRARQYKAGFEVYPLPPVSSEIPGCSFVRVSRHADYISLDVEGCPIISIVSGR